MPTKPIERLLFAQGGLCFFCQRQLPPGDASVEHLVAISNGGDNVDDNCVACCKALNSLLGRMSLKEKLRVFLNQKGAFKCPNGVARENGNSKEKGSATSIESRLALVASDLRKRGAARPRTLESLSSTINALFQKKLTSQQIASLLAELQTKGFVSVTDTKVSYHLPLGDT
jgi:hypothetical protein